MTRRIALFLLVLAGLGLPGAWLMAGGLTSGRTDTYTGTFTIFHGDPLETGGRSQIRYLLHTDDGQTITLRPGSVHPGDLQAAFGQQLTVTGRLVAPGATAAPHLELTAIRPAGADRQAAAPAITGNTPWITIACKFADSDTEPRDMAYFEGMYGTTYPRLDHYWREASYNTIDLSGSAAVGWYTLPKPRSTYITDPDNPKLDMLFEDCAAAADNDVDFPQYYGINLMFNQSLGCCAWGGGRLADFDGTLKFYGITWNPPNAFRTMAIVQHEMGHAYGLGHSYLGDFEYGNPWDVMSKDRYNCAAATDPDYGCIGQHTLANNKYRLGWLPSGRVTTVNSGSRTVTLTEAAQPGSAGDLLAIVPINGSSTDFYTLETRRLVGYDSKLPGPAVIIHRWRSSRATLIDPSEGALVGTDMFTPGETFAGEGGVLITFDDETSTSATVTIHNGLRVWTIGLRPAADTTLDANAPATNFGSSMLLRINRTPERRAALRFNPAEMPAHPIAARLVMSSSTYGGGTVYSLSRYYANTTTPWTEMGLTWANHNPDIRQIEGQVSSGLTQTEFDLTAGLIYPGLESIAIANVDNVAFSSKEGPNPPVLEIDYVLPPGASTPRPTATNTATPTPTATATPTITPTPTPILTSVLTATNDAHVRSSSPNSNYGVLPDLFVQKGSVEFRTYVKFNYRDAPANVARATLRLYVTDGGSDGGTVYLTGSDYVGTTTNWLQEGLTWANAPALEGVRLGSLGAVTAGRWVEFDVTQAVLAAKELGHRVSFGIASDSSNRVIYSSREGANPPQLVLSHKGSPPPTWTATPKATATPTASPTATPATAATATMTLTPTPGPSPTPGASPTASPPVTPEGWVVVLPLVVRP